MRPAILLLAALAQPLTWPSLRAAEPPELKVTVYVIWGTDSEPSDKEDPRKKLPKELEKYLEPLIKAAQKKSLRLEAKPETLTLSAAKPVKVKLPDKSEIDWTITTEHGKTVILQVLTRAKGEKTEVKLRDVDDKKAPRINVVSRAKETLLLVAQFEKSSK